MNKMLNEIDKISFKKGNIMFFAAERIQKIVADLYELITVDKLELTGIEMKKGL